MLMVLVFAAPTLAANPSSVGAVATPTAVPQPLPTAKVVAASGALEDFLTYWGKDKRSETFRNFSLVILAFIGLVFGIWRAITAHRQAKASEKLAAAAINQARIATEQLKTSEQGQFTDRFSRAIEHLGNGQIQIRLGGIYALWRLVEDSTARDVVAIIDILCAYVRNPTRDEVLQLETANLLGTGGEYEGLSVSNPVRPDVQAIMSLLGKEGSSYFQHLPDTYRHDLRGANFRGAYLYEANLSGANLTEANLFGANLTRAKLHFAILSDTIFLDTNVTGAQFQNARYLSQHQINYCLPTAPSRDLPPGLRWPFVEESGSWVNA